MFKSLKQLQRSKQTTIKSTNKPTTTIPTKLYRLLTTKLADTELELKRTIEKDKRTTATLEALQEQYATLHAKFNNAQLANSMLRRLHSNERLYKFHKWLDLLEIEQPGAKLSILCDQVAPYLDWRQLILSRCTCKNMRDRFPIHIQELVMQNMENTVLLLNSPRNPLHPLHPHHSPTLQTTSTPPKTFHSFLLSMTKLTNATFLHFNSTSAMYFASGLRPKHLVVLDVSGSTIGAVAATELGRHAYPSLKILDLTDNNLRAGGLAGLFSSHGLGKTTTLQCLYLGSNRLSMNIMGHSDDTGYVALSNCLASSCKTLEILDLTDNGIDDGGIYALMRGLEQLEKLTRLRLRSSCTGTTTTFGTVGMSDQGAVMLARALKLALRGKRLELVDVQCHQISSRGVIALVHAIYGQGPPTPTQSPKDLTTTMEHDRRKKKKKKDSKKKCCLMLHGNATIGEAVIKPLATSMNWAGSFEHLRRNISEEFGIWKTPTDTMSVLDQNKQEFQRKVRSRIAQKRVQFQKR